ncbi:hypothetical protein B0T18DRAFT_389330 [Schizothecium vesticola]|uniref:Uncharacterized protein n=1 Tax=Schizothecium vesticola TaxID=314040 RepID=A0AA40F2P8_9PEZI|nr:hypothetical protein B0T18DRAFT_389330 [Schizothecium vesticola]
MGCFPSCPALEEGMFRHHAAARRLTVLEFLPPRPASSMNFPATVDGRSTSDSALRERILINEESMARIKAATVRLHNALYLVPNISSAFTGVDKQPPLAPPMLISSSTDTRSSTDNANASCVDTQPSTRNVRVVYSSLKSTYPGIGMPYGEWTTKSIDTLLPSIHGSDSASSSGSTTTLVPPPKETHTIPQSTSYCNISRPLPMPPRARVRGARLTPSYSSPAIYTQDGILIFTKDGPVEIPRPPFRPFSLGRCLTLEERVARLERMREDALAVVEARALEGIDTMPVTPLDEIEEENDVEQDQSNVEAV